MGKHGGRELAAMKRGLRQGLDLGEWFWEESRKVASTISVKDRIFLDSARMYIHTHLKAEFGPALEALLGCSKEIWWRPEPDVDELCEPEKGPASGSVN